MGWKDRLDAAEVGRFRAANRRMEGVKWRIACANPPDELRVTSLFERKGLEVLILQSNLAQTGGRYDARPAPKLPDSNSPPLLPTSGGFILNFLTFIFV